jgi:GntR family transcriptional regulator
MEVRLNALAGRIHLDLRSDEPIVTQIVRQIEALVTDGTFEPGDQLPTVREVAIDLRINFSTVARAYRILDERRLISTQRGRGTFIEEPPVPGGSPTVGDGAGDHLTEALAAWARDFIQRAAGLGASPEQIEHVFLQQLQAWLQDHPTQSGNQPGG